MRVGAVFLERLLNANARGVKLAGLLCFWVAINKQLRLNFLSDLNEPANADSEFYIPGRFFICRSNQLNISTSDELSGLRSGFKSWMPFL